MRITDEMVAAALKAWISGPRHLAPAMRAALEAALGQFMLQYGDNVELQEAEQIGFNRSAACIEDLAGALKLILGAPTIQNICGWYNEMKAARATLERWGLK